MDSITTNVPDTIREQAKQLALKIIEQNPGCTSYVRPEDLETQSLFIPVVSIIKPTKEDFYEPIPEVGIMAKPPLVNLLREKTGVNIIRTERSKSGKFSWIAHSFGEKRQPDGSMATQDAIYEFDVELIAELDAINNPQKYGTDIAKRKHLLKMAKTGQSRAVTGAQHALIHKLAHVARSFKTPEELMRGMIVVRIDRNINGILADPELRRAALDRMLGATEAVYGPKQLPVELAEESAPEASVEEVDDFPAEAPPKAEKPPEKTPLEKAKDILRDYLPKMKRSKTATDLINTMLANDGATLEAVSNLLDRCIAYVQSKGGAA